MEITKNFKGFVRQLLQHLHRTDRLIILAAFIGVVFLLFALPGYLSSPFYGAYKTIDVQQSRSVSIDFLEQLGHERPAGATAFSRKIRSESGNNLRYHYGRQTVAQTRQSMPEYMPPALIQAHSLSTTYQRDNFLRMLLFNRGELSEASTAESIMSDLVRFEVELDENHVPFRLATTGRNRFRNETLNRALLGQVFPENQLADDAIRLQVILDENTLPGASSEAHILSRADLEKMAKYVLAQTRWASASLETTDITVQSSDDEHTLYRVSMASQQEILGRTLSVETDIDHKGYIHQVNPIWTVTQSGTDQLPKFIHNQSRISILVILGILAFFMFIYRLIRQQLDLKSARNDAIFAFIAIFLVSLNSSFSDAMQNGLFTPGLWDFIGNIVGSIALGLGAALLIYIFSSIASSISHEIWPAHIHTLNLFRRGYVYNQPVGLSILRGLGMGVLILVTPVAIWLTIPSTEIMTSGDFLFLSDQYPAGFGHVLGGAVYGAQQVLFLVLLLFLALIRKRIRHEGLFFALGVTVIFWLDISPASLLGYPNVVVQLVAGGIIMYSFHKYGALTAFFAPIFAALWWTVLGGMSTIGSPDVLQIIILSGVLVLALVLGVAGAGSGVSLTKLPDFVPSYILELANRERMSRELEIARQVQQTFLPVSNPVIEGFELFAACQPASEVGGDYYEFIPLENHNIAVSIGDVSGKGIQAAFFMTLVKGYTQSLAETTADPKTFLTRVNSLFYRNAPRGTFITMIYGYLDTQTRIFHAARAGHNPILVYRAVTGKAAFMQTAGMALGLVNDSRFAESLEAVAIKLEQGDCILLYTDGYTEAMNRAGDQYGEERFRKIVEEHAGGNLSELIARIDSDVQNFTGDTARHDDMTIMGIRVL